MAVTVLTLQQCWIALPAARARDDARRGRNCTLRRMGGANGSRECAPDDRLRETHHRSGQQWMGIAALHPSYKSVTLDCNLGSLGGCEERGRKPANSDCPVD